MAIHIRLIRNNIRRSSSYGKYFAKTVSQGEVSLEAIAAKAHRMNGFSGGTVKAVVTDLMDVLQRELAEGKTVVFPGLGRFSLRVESEGVDNPKTFSLRRHITRIVCGFLPAGFRSRGRRICYNASQGVTAVWEKGMKP